LDNKKSATVGSKNERSVNRYEDLHDGTDTTSVIQYYSSATYNK